MRPVDYAPLATNGVTEHANDRPWECVGPGLCMRGAVPQEEEEPNLAFVGNGRGRYRQEMQYKFVGEGKGEFDMVPQSCGTPLHGRLPMVCYCAALGLLGALLGLGLWPLLSHSPGPGDLSLSRVVVPGPSYDCEAKGQDWETTWSFSQKAWCCKEKQLACPSSLKRQAAFGCQAASAHERDSWSTEQQDWCCAHKRVGCPSPAETTPMHFDCQKDEDKLWVAWPMKKKVWCCINNHKGCPTQSPGARHTTQPRFDCNAGFSNWKIGWSAEKKAFCCSRSNRGCPSAGESSPCDQDCSYNGKSGSCRQRILFVSSLRFAGQNGACDSARSAVISVCPGCEACSVNASGCMQPIPEGPSGPATTAAPQPFDCLAGFASWEEAWTDEKKAWCCKHANRGCATDLHKSSSTSEPYECLAGLANWEADWSPKKQKWCCEHRSRGCAPSTTTAPSVTTTTVRFDCLAGWAAWEKLWDDDKKSWCCRHVHRGCAAPSTTSGPSTSSRPYDCSAGLSRTSLWAEDKRRWCCEHEKKGCKDAKDQERAAEQTTVQTTTSSTPEHYDCSAGFATWHRGWSERKKAWCCHREQRGCPTAVASSLPFDCLAGFDHWEAGWSEGKKRWCCRNRGRGCPSRSHT